MTTISIRDLNVHSFGGEGDGWQKEVAVREFVLVIFSYFNV